MNQNIITVTGRTVNTITAEIIAISNQTRQMVVMSAIEIGRRLCEVKDQIGHGEWGNYLKQEVDMSHRTANNCMSIYREFEKNPNSQALANLTYTNAVRLLALPEDEREEIMQEHDVADMSSRELEKVIKERDDAKAAQAETLKSLEAAQAESRDMAQQLLDAQQRAANAKSSEDAWQVEIDKLKKKVEAAEAAATKAKNQLQYEKEHPTIPASMKKELVEKAVAKAEKDTSSKYQSQLEAAQKEVSDAKAALAAAENAAAEARNAVAEANNSLAAAQKAAKFSDPVSAVFRDTFQTWRDDFNRLMGALIKVTNTDPGKGEELRVAINKMLDMMKEKVSDDPKTSSN